MTFCRKEGVLAFIAKLTVSLTLLGLVVSHAFAQMPPPKVEVLELMPQEMRQWDHFSGRISAVESVEIRPLVSGRIEKVLFREGQRVELGQALFVIDPRPFEAEVKRAEATLATARAKLHLSAQAFRRSSELLGDKLISQSVYDESLTDNEIAKAAVLEAESQLLNAQLDLEYAHIDAPIAGTVGRAELTAGNIVGAGAAAPVLTTIVAQERVYAEFRVDEQSYLKFIRDEARPSEMPVQLSLKNDPQMRFEGHIHAFDNHLDSTSGTIRGRAVFENSNGMLTPGMYADVHVGSVQKQAVFVLPERAIGTNQDRRFVFVVDDENVAQYREIVLGEQLRGQRIIRSGISAGDRVVVNGLSRVRAQTPVNPVAAEITQDVASREF
ncbi:multidrug efflux system membrane fusion protein [Alteromonadaceae bacterium 2753L.S.0a.02]|nr:multidrug efflux system membrane fusion protein [Alteromonadaceae bacterium 2753L.S.0a.02]